MYKPRVVWNEVLSPFDAFPKKMQWCVVSTNPRYKLDPSDREKDRWIFGHGDTVQEAWKHYLEEIASYEEFLQECDEPDLSK